MGSGRATRGGGGTLQGAPPGTGVGYMSEVGVPGAGAWGRGVLASPGTGAPTGLPTGIRDQGQWDAE